MKRALIFDFDGLMVDTETCEYLCWKRVFEEHGQALPESDWVHIVGTAEVADLRRTLELKAGRPLDWDGVERRRVAHYHELYDAQDLLPGVRGLFSEAKRRGYAIGVASNSTVTWVRRGLDRFGLSPEVAALRGRDTARQPKPHPDPYLEVLEELGAEAALSFAFEDSATGVASAKAAGLTVVAVPNQLTRLHDLSLAHVVLKSLEDFQWPVPVEGT